MNDDLLKILVFTKSGGKLEYDKTKNELLCKESGLAYPIRDGVPVMLIDSAREVN